MRVVAEVAEVEHSMSAPDDHGSAGAAPALQSSGSANAANAARLASELDECRRRCDRLAERERRIAELLDSKSPEKIEHDLRNVMNELQLLRTLFEKQG